MSRPHQKEWLSAPELARQAGVSESTARRWIKQHELGKVGGRWRVSRVLAAMYLDGNETMRRYWAGDRTGLLVAPYFLRLGIDPTTLGQGA